MGSFTEQFGQDTIRAVTKSERTMNTFGTFTLWLAANFVITSIMTGMMFIPDISITDAFWAILIGSAVGAIPLVMTGVIGTRTGLSTMVISRAAFGQRGAALPAIINTIILVGWSWIQAYMAGLSLNFAVEYTTGYSNISLFVIVTEVIVVGITIYGHKGLEKVEKYISLAMVTLAISVFYKLFSSYDIVSLIEMKLSENPYITTIVAFDIVVATAFSWMSSVCDFNRYCQSEKKGAVATYSGYLLASLLAMGMGAVISGFSLLQGMEQTYDPAVLLSQHGFGLIASIVVFFSVVSTNVMALYSANMSLMNVLPKANFAKIVLVTGIICTIGGLLKETLMNNFYNFILLIATLFIPVFAIILVDYYILKKAHYDAEEILSNSKKMYNYQNGINWAAYGTYIAGAIFAYYFTYVHPLFFGSSIITFFVSGAMYWLLMVATKQVGSGAGKGHVEEEKRVGING